MRIANERPFRVAMVSEHASPLAVLGGVDAGGQNVHVAALATELGAASVGHADDPPPVPLDAAIVFAPAGELVPVALAALEQGGTLADVRRIAGTALPLTLVNVSRHVLRTGPDVDAMRATVVELAAQYRFSDDS